MPQAKRDQGSRGETLRKGTEEAFSGCPLPSSPFSLCRPLLPPRFLIHTDNGRNWPDSRPSLSWRVRRRVRGRQQHLGDELRIEHGDSDFSSEIMLYVGFEKKSIRQ